MICTKCQIKINPLRVKALPKTKVCVDCSSTEAVSGFMVYDHKTAPTISICSQEIAEEIRRLGDRRGTGIPKSMKSI